jgi:hypothetical protein
VSNSSIKEKLFCYTSSKIERYSILYPSSQVYYRYQTFFKNPNNNSKKCPFFGTGTKSSKIAQKHFQKTVKMYLVPACNLKKIQCWLWVLNTGYSGIRLKRYIKRSTFMIRYGTRSFNSPVLNTEKSRF